jgi:acyl CoA:acetate/3-ketoacid CoA transferase beta subunit
MEHVTSNGDLRILRECSYPLTCKACVDLIVTDLAVIEVSPAGLVLKEVVPGATAEDIQTLTEPTLIIPDDLKEIEL